MAVGLRRPPRRSATWFLDKKPRQNKNLDRATEDASFDGAAAAFTEEAGREASHRLI
jgi:hypothetical protein